MRFCEQQDAIARGGRETRGGVRDGGVGGERGETWGVVDGGCGEKGVEKMDGVCGRGGGGVCERDPGGGVWGGGENVCEGGYVCGECVGGGGGVGEEGCVGDGDRRGVWGCGGGGGGGGLREKWGLDSWRAGARHFGSHLVRGGGDGKADGCVEVQGEEGMTYAAGWGGCMELDYFGGCGW